MNPESNISLPKFSGLESFIPFYSILCGCAAFRKGEVVLDDVHHCLTKDRVRVLKHQDAP